MASKDAAVLRTLLCKIRHKAQLPDILSIYEAFASLTRRLCVPEGRGSEL